MNRKILLNKLKLVYNPVTSYEFTFLKNEDVIQQILSDSKIYIICQRPILTFENLICQTGDPFLRFEIHQKGNPNSVKVILPIFQKNLSNPNQEISLHLNYLNKFDISKTFPFNNIVSLRLFQDNNFLVWFSPEKFIYNFREGLIDASVDGDLSEFNSYNVHYIGKSTDQQIWKRLTGHEKLQDILSLEPQLTYGDLPSQEIVLLFFKFEDNISIESFDPDTPLVDMVDSMMGVNLPNIRSIYIDAEKALINAMQPKYNKILFKNYPLSKDGLSKFKFNSLSYTFIDPLNLIYPNGEIDGGNQGSINGGDLIIIDENLKPQVFKVSSTT